MVDFVCVQVLGLILWIVCWTDLFSAFHEMNEGQPKPPIYFVTPLIVGMTMVSDKSILKMLSPISVDKIGDTTTVCSQVSFMSLHLTV